MQQLRRHLWPIRTSWLNTASDARNGVGMRELRPLSSLLKKIVLTSGLCLFAIFDCPLYCQTNMCGLHPKARRTVSGGARSSSRPIFPLVHLLGVSQNDGTSSVIVNVNPWPGGPLEWYSSSDIGVNWKKLNSNPCTSIPHYGEFTSCLRSRASGKIVYRTANNSEGPEVELSKDGGKEWTSFMPGLTGIDHINQFRFLETSPTDAARVYGWLTTTASKRFNLYVSNDFGREFRPLLATLINIVESQADASTLYGIVWSQNGIRQLSLTVSRDGGHTWTNRPAAEGTCSPFYRDPKSRVVRSWREKREDFEVIPPDPIYQMEADPSDPDTLYILSFNGLYLSEDGGQSFVLLPLATDKILSIDAIALDPSNGKYIYAMVDARRLFVSSDKGCHWHEVIVPLPSK